MPDVPKARRYMEAVGRGVSQAHRIYFTDQHTYVVKLAPNPDGPKVLANEMVGNRLAQSMGIEVLDGSIVEVPRDFIAQQPELQGYRT